VTPLRRRMLDFSSEWPNSLYATCMNATYLHVLILLMPTLAASQAKKVTAAIDGIANEALDQGPIAGISICVTRGQRTVLLKGYGSSNLELETVTTPKTLYHIVHLQKPHFCRGSSTGRTAQAEP
jgi:CubicO group peptidase (beta-lactamase class C family)